MNDAIEKSLLTWYPKNHKLHLDPLHPAIKLAGEAGEILDLYGKHQYKPNFSWWDCKYCKKMSINLYDIDPDYKCRCGKYTSFVLDELGDYWYYLRILSYIYKVEFQDKISENKNSLDKLLADMNYISATLYRDLAMESEFRAHRLNWCYVYLTGILKLLNTSLDELTELNYIKLNSEPTAHGWKGA